ncbi:uncharacterized protein LOC111622756 [Centruroides sculpturatus]|uniref:uncharacterized protein LOC111622738 n=1 Tax=Centruroides sculpturatus TaxID=218467 RepID=UPI000C6E5D0E|nr:uncharacterized protein LOC111622738 [Centruroides sculpturatus]XP_023220951.1 uncharacterized protein LOC111622756 [Centruroides sculpturatus]
MFCSVAAQIYYIYITGQMITILVCCSEGLFVMAMRSVHLSKELQDIEDDATAVFFQGMMEKHLEIREFFQQINKQWKILFPLVYSHSVYLCCILLYGAIFVDMDESLRQVTAIVALVMLIGCLFVSWALSAMTSMIYDNFVSVAVFSSVSFPLRFKYKVCIFIEYFIIFSYLICVLLFAQMVCFLKRFGRNPIGLSMGGYFFIKRNFLIRMASGLYSEFSTLLQLTGVLDRKKCTRHITNEYRMSLQNETNV